MRINRLLTMAGFFCLGLMVALLPLETAQAADKVIELKLANFFPPFAKQSKICEEFAKDLDVLTGGRIKVNYFPGGSLLKGPGIYKGIKSGLADMGYSLVYYTPGRMPVTEIAGLPLGYPSAWVASHVINDLYTKVRPKEWDKVKVLWFNGIGPGSIATKKPVQKLEDLKGLILRGPGVTGDMTRALGGSPAPTPMPEVYDALSKGVIDGTWTNLEALKSWRLGEVVNYFTDIWELGMTYPFYMVMNKKSYNKLPPDLKEIFDNLCGEYRERSALMWNEIDIAGKIFALQKGVKFINLPVEEIARWKKSVEPVIDSYVKRLVKKGFAESDVREWISFLRERIEYHTKKQIEYRIPSPTGPTEMRPENIGK